MLIFSRQFRQCQPAKRTETILQQHDNDALRRQMTGIKLYLGRIARTEAATMNVYKNRKRLCLFCRFAAAFLWCKYIDCQSVFTVARVMILVVIKFIAPKASWFASGQLLQKPIRPGIAHPHAFPGSGRLRLPKAILSCRICPDRNPLK